MTVGAGADEERILALLHVAVSGVAERFTAGAEPGSRERLGYDVGAPRWPQLRGGVLHRAAHVRYGTGRMSPHDASARWPAELPLPWVDSTVGDLGELWTQEVGRVVDVPGRAHFLALLEAVEDLRVEARLAADLPGFGAELDLLRRSAAARSSPPSPDQPRAFLRDRVQRLSLGAAAAAPATAEWPALSGHVATIVTRVCGVGASFADVVVGALFLHRITLELPYLAIEGAPLGVDLPADAGRPALLSWLRKLAVTPRLRSTGGEGEARWDGSLTRPVYRDKHFGRYYGYAGAGRVREAVYLLDPEGTKVRSSR